MLYHITYDYVVCISPLHDVINLTYYLFTTALSARVFARCEEDAFVIIIQRKRYFLFLLFIFYLPFVQVNNKGWCQVWLGNT